MKSKKSKTTFSVPHFTLEFQNVSEAKEEKLKAVREAFLARTKKDVGFYDWPEQAGDLVDDIEKTAAEWRNRFQGALLMGIGGSHLGPAALMTALRSVADEEAFPLLWVNNVDVPALQRAEMFLKKGKRTAVVISKSGETLETLSSFLHLSSLIDLEGVVCITDPKKGELRRLATENKWKSYSVPENIGGRFSAFTAVGLFPCALAGLNTKALIAGACAMKNYLDRCLVFQDPALAFAANMYTWDEKGCGQQYLMPYLSSLELLSDWFVQLWAESLGKNRKGPTPGTALGSRDQHSLLQLFKEGPVNKVVGFLDVEQQPTPRFKSPAFSSPSFEYLMGTPVARLNHEACLATQESLNRSEVPTFRMVLDGITAESLGALLFFFEAACGYAGELYGINAYDQPGVEEAKKLLRAALHQEK